MQDYRKVSPMLWIRGSGKRLRGDPVAQVVALYLATAPNATMTGLYHVNVGTIAGHTGLSEDDVRSALERIESAGFAHLDEEEEVAWVPNMLRMEVGRELKPGDKKRGAIKKLVRTYEGHRFEAAFWARYAEWFPAEAASIADEPPRADAPSMGHQGGTSCPIEGASKGHPQLARAPDAPSRRGIEGASGVDPSSGEDTEQDQEQDQDPPPYPPHAPDDVIDMRRTQDLVLASSGAMKRAIESDGGEYRGRETDRPLHVEVGHEADAWATKRGLDVNVVLDGWAMEWLAVVEVRSANSWRKFVASKVSGGKPWTKRRARRGRLAESESVPVPYEGPVPDSFGDADIPTEEARHG